MHMCVCLCICRVFGIEHKLGVCDSDAVDDALSHGKLCGPRQWRMCTDQLQAVMRTKKDSRCQVSGETWDYVIIVSIN